MTRLRDLKKDLLIPASVFAGIFFLSLVVFFIHGLFEKDLLLFFPLHAGGAIAGEGRSLVRQKNQEQDLQLMLEEIILGPADIRHSGVLHRKTRVRSVLIRNGQAYVDLSSDAIFVGGEIKMSFEEVLEILKNTIYFNFPSVKKILITIEGQVPGESSYRLMQGERVPTVQK